MSHVHSEEDSNVDRSLHSNDEAESEGSNCTERKKKATKNECSSVQKSDNEPTTSGTSNQSKDKKSKDGKVGDMEEDSSKEGDDVVDDIKLEVLSDDVNSALSDINPPSFSTRLRRRKIERRKNRAASSTSSAIDSDTRKTKSEPILITLDSSDDDISVTTTSSRPNRSARVRGEIIRKMNKLSHLRIPNYKSSESSSSSDNTKKKKSKKKSKVLSSKIKKSLSIQVSNQKILKSKQSVEIRASNVYAGRKETRRLKIKNLRRRFERKKNEKPHYSRPKIFLRTHSRKSVISTERKRMPRRCSAISLGSYNEDNDSELKRERPKRRNSGLGIKIKEEILDKKNVEESELKKNPIEEDIRKIIGASKLDLDSKGSELKNSKANLNDGNTDSKSSKKHIDGRSFNRGRPKLHTDCAARLTSGTEKGEPSSPSVSDTNKEKTPELNADQKISSHSHCINSDNKTDAENIQADLDQIKTNRPNLPEEKKSSEGTGIKKKERSSNLGAKPKSHKKSKIKPPVTIIRRRGRPRLSETTPKPVKTAAPYYSIKPQVPFLQNSFCFDVSPKLSKCRECRIALYRNSRRMYHSYCRFMEYRKLCYNKNGVILSAGFANPTEATAEHLSIWLPDPKIPPKDLNFETAKSLLEHVGDQFCDLVLQEKEAHALHVGLHQVITWKRLVQGVREMCDVCSTTIFNIHWVCPICGFAVCIDCYKVRKQGIVIEDEEDQPKDRDEYKWLLCTLRQSHRQDSLVITQIIPGDALWIVKNLLHNTREKMNIPSYCKCNQEKAKTPNKPFSTGINKQIMSCVTQSFPPTPERIPFFNLERNMFKNYIGHYGDLDIEVSGSAKKWLEKTGINAEAKLDLLDENFNSFEDLKLIVKGELSYKSPSEGGYEITNFNLDDIMTSVKNCQSEKRNVKHFSQRYPQPSNGRDPLPIIINTKTESELSFSQVPHSWFCNGRLLFLHKADHPDNLALFQEQWKRGQPILVKGVDERLDMSLWHPDGFCRDFGEVKNDLVDCKTGAILKNLPMKKFWEGFENFSKRLTDENGEYMLLKLKDWPPGEDFSEKLPRRFEDLMRGLPLPEYTHRNGILNLAGRLPSSFVRPDLGPKMYNAYGSALYPAKGTTNLHLDVSDAVNVMVYVGIPSDGDTNAHIEEALKAIDEGGCDSLMRTRVRYRGTKPGALWHIYNARDADKIRDMLTKIAIERGEKLEAHHDPIHDQNWYIDSKLRLRLYEEYGVEGYAIAQCLGDAVFIPAGAPHQVRNLHSCVKVAEDFVSPENIAHCFKLTQEFRNLSDTHTNHEDKLQIKNIIYHVVRDSLSHLIPKDWIPPLDPQSLSSYNSMR